MILEGERIFLRKVKVSDIDLLYTWENDPMIWEVGDNRSAFTRKDIEDFVLSEHDLESQKQLRLMICLNDGKAIGCIDLYDYDNYHSRAGVGILIYESDHRKNGFGNEAIGLLIKHCKDELKLKQLFCHVLEDNKASFKLFERNGFATTGKKVAWRKNGEAWSDEFLMQLLLH